MNGKKILSTVGTAVVIISVVVGLKFYNKSQVNAQIRGEAVAIVENVQGYGSNADYFQLLIDHAHPVAFEEAYRMGGRRRSAEFDDARYVQVLFATMLDKAKSEQRSKIANALETHAKQNGV